MVRSGARGQASVEFILVIPLLLIVAAAVVQVAYSLNCYLGVTAASREGARKGAETNSAGAARQAALSAASTLPGERPRVEVAFPQGRSRGDQVRVTVIYKVPLVVPGLKQMLPEFRFRRSTSMALERDE
jgi:Flp pilus assembly protein TadG